MVGQNDHGGYLVLCCNEPPVALPASPHAPPCILLLARAYCASQTDLSDPLRCLHGAVNALMGPEERALLAQSGVRAVVERLVARQPEALWSQHAMLVR